MSTPTPLTGFFALARRWRKRGLLRKASDWPTTESSIEQVEKRRANTGLVVVTLAYTYKVEGERYVGRESFDFVRDEDAAEFKAGCQQRVARVCCPPDTAGFRVVP